MGLMIDADLNVSTGSSPLSSGQLIQPSQIFVKTNLGMNEFGCSSQLTYSGPATVTAAIVGFVARFMQDEDKIPDT